MRLANIDPVQRISGKFLFSWLCDCVNLEMLSCRGFEVIETQSSFHRQLTKPVETTLIKRFELNTRFQVQANPCIALTILPFFLMVILTHLSLHFQILAGTGTDVARMLRKRKKTCLSWPG